VKRPWVLAVAALFAALVWLLIHRKHAALPPVVVVPPHVVASAAPPAILAPTCDGIGPKPPTACAPATDALADLVRAANGFTPGGVPCLQTALLPPTWPKTVTAALAGAARVDLHSLSRTERIVAQNAALRLALCVGSMGQPKPASSAIGRAAFGIVKRFALPAADLDQGNDTPDDAIAAWLGQPSTWKDRLTPSAHSLHQTGMGLTLSERPVLAGALWANIGNAVAVDTALHAHVTNVVGKIDMRRSDASGANCVASLDLAWLRCGAPMGLHLVDALAAEKTPPSSDALLFAVHSERLRCRLCHAPGTAVTTALETDPAQEIAARHQRLVTEVDAKLAAVASGL
jgi:hypothetical protein